jgi:hypothetical protein
MYMCCTSYVSCIKPGAKPEVPRLPVPQMVSTAKSFHLAPPAEVVNLMFTHKKLLSDAQFIPEQFQYNHLTITEQLDMGTWRTLLGFTEVGAGARGALGLTNGA